MARNVVVQSINLEGDMRCVDIFHRPDGTFGFEEYRRDSEDGRGWFPVAEHRTQVFRSADDAMSAACASVGWLAAAIGSEY